MLWLFMIKSNLGFVQNVQLFTKRRNCCTITQETCTQTWNINVHTVTKYSTKVEIKRFTLQQFMKTTGRSHVRFVTSLSKPKAMYGSMKKSVQKRKKLQMAWNYPKRPNPRSNIKQTIWNYHYH